MNDYAKAVRELLAQHGCSFVRHGKGDHDIWTSPLSDRRVTVPTRIKSRHTANAILKQAGLEKAF
jgi:predicted RNA binding protein YcfA (HicA-like mRNA interferase family)